MRRGGAGRWAGYQVVAHARREYRSHGAPEQGGGGLAETTRRRGTWEGQPGPPRFLNATPSTSDSRKLGGGAGSLSHWCASCEQGTPLTPPHVRLKVLRLQKPHVLHWRG